MGAVTTRHGQAQTEYILLIALVALAIVVALIAFRDSVIEFISDVILWLNADPPAVIASTPPDLPSGQHSPTPEPSPSPPPEADSWEGTWCYTVGDNPGHHTTTAVSNGDGTYQVHGNDRYSLVPAGPDRFTLRYTNPNQGPVYTAPFVRGADGRYRPPDAHGVEWWRC
jgi:Flp pilus assembly pilin Flp